MRDFLVRSQESEALFGSAHSAVTIFLMNQTSLSDASHVKDDAALTRSPIASLSMKLFLGGLFVVFLLADFAFFPSASYVREELAPTGCWDCLCGGLIVAQMGLLTVIAVLGTGPTLSRQLLVVPHLFFAVLAAVAGLFVMDAMAGDVYVLPSEQIGPFLYIIPLLFLASQIPLWGFRILFHWRIAPNHLYLNKTAPTVTLAGL